MDYKAKIAELEARIARMENERMECQGVEEALRASEERYRTLFQKAGDAIFIIEAEGPEAGRILDANEAAVQMHGYSLAELRTMKIQQIDGPTDAARVADRIGRMLGGQWVREEIFHRKKDGTLFPIKLSAGIISLGEKKVVLGIDTDITQQVAAEAALHEQIDFLQTLIDTLPHPIFYKDAQGLYLGCNQSFEAFTGTTKASLIGKSVFAVSPPELAQLYFDADQRLFSSRQPQSYEAKVRDADGGWRDVIFKKAVFYRKDGQLGGLIGAIIDITERKRAEEEKALYEKQLRQAQKVEAIGTLAGGIAHDFNNILSAIMGFTEIALHDLPATASQRPYLSKVLQAGDRARSLVHQILTFSRATEQEKRPMEVRFIVKEALKLLQATLPSTISIDCEFASAATILADPTQIHQVVMNLCTNAAYAMRETGGRLTIRLSDVAPQAEPESGPGEGGERQVRMCVEDTGTGMPPEVVERIFDPFFTTKKPGEGTGMGLSVVHGIVKSCNGTIRVRSTPGQGSSFTIHFPVIDSPAPAAKPALPALPLGSERILFVDDEPFQVDLAENMLQRLGYRVTAVNSSLRALDVFSAAPDRFDLVVTDMTMPDMTGDLLARHLLKIRPELPVILCTGYSHRLTERSVQELGLAGIALKPLIMKDLALMIRTALDTKAA